MIAGMGSLLTSYYSRSVGETNYSNAINLADAGLNYELRRITANVASADLPGSATPHGNTVSFGNGSFRVYCTMADGVTSWDEQAVPFCILSTGISGSVSRQVKISATGSGLGGTYAVFGVQQGIMDAAPTIVQGDVGTNGFFTFNNNPTISGNVIFNGATSNWQSPPHATYTVQHKSTAVSWPTVESIATSAFGLLGLTTVSLVNDNLRAVPPIVSPNLLVNSGTETFVGKAGGANYYLTSLTCNGGTSIAFNNTAGPITIWVGPSGSSSTFNFNGGTASVKMAADSTKPVKIYIATTNDVIQNGNTELDAGIYNVNSSGSGPRNNQWFSLDVHFDYIEHVYFQQRAGYALYVWLLQSIGSDELFV